MTTKSPNKGMTGLFWDRARKYPPFVCRLLARHKGGAPLTDEEISEKSGLSIYSIVSIYNEMTFDSVHLSQMRKFLTGCGIDFTDSKCMNRIDQYMRFPNRLKYLKKSPLYETVFKPLIRKIKNASHT